LIDLAPLIKEAYSKWFFEDHITLLTEFKKTKYSPEFKQLNNKFKKLTKQDIGSVLVMASQRVPRYSLLLNQLLSQTPLSPTTQAERNLIQQAIIIFDKISTSFNGLRLAMNNLGVFSASRLISNPLNKKLFNTLSYRRHFYDYDDDYNYDHAYYRRPSYRRPARYY
jgi:hypothetical protein